ncbi:hypothetical protein MTP99_005308 [Tenebrio molitor]|nr:hypothetical protein MTP99_005308 [Tenebrio molitor]
MAVKILNSIVRGSTIVPNGGALQHCNVTIRSDTIAHRILEMLLTPPRGFAGDGARQDLEILATRKSPVEDRFAGGNCQNESERCKTCIVFE